MQYVAVMPHNKVPNKQLALWTMYIGWEPRCFFRLLPNATYNEVMQQFICLSRHWSDKLFILENIEYTDHELYSLMSAVPSMQNRQEGLQVCHFKDRLTLLIRRDVLDIMEAGGLRDNWFGQHISFAAIAQRAGCRIAEYDGSSVLEEGEETHGIQESS